MSARHNGARVRSRRRRGAAESRSAGPGLVARVRGHAESSEAGDTLIEVLIAIVIIALTVTALLGGLVTAITSSTTEQSLSTVDSVLNNFAQAAQYEVQQANFFINCTTTPYRFIERAIPGVGPGGFVGDRVRDRLRRQHEPHRHPGVDTGHDHER